MVWENSEYDITPQRYEPARITRGSISTGEPSLDSMLYGNWQHLPYCSLSIAVIPSNDKGSEKRYPCISSHLSSCSTFACASSSTPSATTFRRSEWASEMIVC